MSRPIRTLGHRVLNTSLLLTFGFSVGHGMHDYVGTIQASQGPSMLPTLNANGDWLLYNARYKRGRGVKVGDVVAVRHPLVPGFDAVKRVVGLPGDFVETGERDMFGEALILQVPKGHCWLLGDNQEMSRDSRDYGPIPLALIKSKVVAKIWPFSERKWLENTFKPLDSG